MSWTRDTDLCMSEEDVQRTLEAIGENFSRQDWGWSAECDIALSNGKVVFSGAEYSRYSSLPRRFLRQIRVHTT